MWELPSGKKEIGESTEKALAREIKEETGIIFESSVPFSVFDYQIEKENEIRDTIQIYFLLEVNDSSVHLSSEHRNSAWISEDEIDRYDITESTKKVIREAFAIKNARGRA
jgi:8-oxo-dGTP diphosphatase